jgi:hypothetical protein
VTTAAATFAVLAKLQMNGAFDPDGALSAGQPATFVKYMTWYSKCVVTASRVTIKLNNQPLVQGANAAQPVLWGITLLTNNTSLATAIEAVTGGPRVYSMLFANPDVGTQSLSVDIAKYLGVNDLENNPDYACTAAANPAQLVVAQLWLQNNSAGTAYNSYTVEMQQDVTFYDPVIIT